MIIGGGANNRECIDIFFTRTYVGEHVTEESGSFFNFGGPRSAKIDVIENVELSVSLRKGWRVTWSPVTVLLIVTFRPEFESPWIGRPHVTFLSINRLAQRDIDVMIDGVIGNRSLPPSTSVPDSWNLIWYANRSGRAI
jgi:hypothetical protein